MEDNANHQCVIAWLHNGVFPWGMPSDVSLIFRNLVGSCGLNDFTYIAHYSSVVAMCLVIYAWGEERWCYTPS